MYAITGITGQIGGRVARNLLAVSQPVRAILRDQTKAAPWAKLGCEIALADITDASALSAAFQDADAVFILPPPCFDPSPDFAEARAVAKSVRSALESARPGRVVDLSTIGAQAKHPNLLSQHTLIEQTLSDISIPITFLRCAWFIENTSWDLPQARETGVILSYLQPPERALPMVSTEDIGRAAAELLQEHWTGKRIVELEGPHRISPNDISATLSKILGRSIRAEAVPRDTWEKLFKSQGMKNPEPRIQMLDGFNQGWIEFEKPTATRKGTISLETALRTLVGHLSQTNQPAA